MVVPSRPPAQAAEEWLHARLRELEERVAESSAVLSNQQAEFMKLVAARGKAMDAGSALEARFASDSREENNTSVQLECTFEELTPARHRTKELEAERRKLLREIENQKQILGFHAIKATQSFEVQSKTGNVLKKSAEQARKLRQTLRHLGDHQAELHEQEVEERELRRKLRQSILDKLTATSQICTNHQMRLAGKDVEVQRVRDQMADAQAAEQQYLQETAELRCEVRRCEGSAGPAHGAQRAELQHQIRVLTSEHELLLEKFREARERLFSKQQRALEGRGSSFAALNGGA